MTLRSPPAARASMLEQATRTCEDQALAALKDWATRTETASVEPLPSDGLQDALASTEGEETLPRYEDRGFLARGGMGEVRRVYDRRLDRVVVQKILRSTDQPRVRRFWIEATVTAHLEHPGIIPVHDFGQYDDGAPFFTMKEVQGETFGRRLERLHASSRMGWGRTSDGLSLRTLVDELRRAAQAVAFAHGQGVLHRDLKPDNLMVGAFGEVLVLDWGIALVNPKGWSRPLPDLDREGQVAGTPSFMAPEQAWGTLSSQGTWTDAWSLGAILHHLLWGRPPWSGSAMEIVQQIRQLNAPVLPADGPRPIPTALRALCAACLRPQPEDRLPDAARFAAALGDWLDGDRREEEALALVDRARAMIPTIGVQRGRAEELEAIAREGMERLRSFDPVAVKRAAWMDEERAAAARTQAEALEDELVQLLQTALERAPELQAAHRLLADHYQAQHEAALDRGDAREAARAEASLRQHDRGAHEGWLRAEAWLSLRTEPAGVEVEVLRHEVQERRLVALPTGIRTVTPIDRLALPAGSYLLRIRPGQDEVLLPVLLRRTEHLQHRSPDGPTALRLPPPGSLSPDEVFVPGGWTLVGDAHERGGQPRRRVWVDSFVMARNPVTNAEYLEFVNDLLRQGRAEEARAVLPRVPRDGDTSPYQLTEEGYALGLDAHGDRWDERWPVLNLRYDDALAYSAWRSTRDGHAWRFPSEAEWERAARGADGRRFPWGDHAEPTWANCSGARPGRPLPGPIGEPAGDLSPLGVHGLAGNARCWTGDSYQASNTATESHAGAWHLTKGGCWNGAVALGAAAARYGQPDGGRTNQVSIRLRRSWP